MARQSLGSMLGTVNVNETAAKEAADEHAPSPRPIQPVPEPAETPAKPHQHPPAAPTRKSAPRRAREPKYLTLQRKEARLADKQLDQLTALTRRLNKRRRGAGERITDNTLIRVAVDMLLDRADHLAGTTEDELRRSAGL